MGLWLHAATLEGISPWLAGSGPPPSCWPTLRSPRKPTPHGFGGLQSAPRGAGTPALCPRTVSVTTRTTTCRPGRGGALCDGAQTGCTESCGISAPNACVGPTALVSHDPRRQWEAALCPFCRPSLEDRCLWGLPLAAPLSRPSQCPLSPDRCAVLAFLMPPLLQHCTLAEWRPHSPSLRARAWRPCSLTTRDCPSPTLRAASARLDVLSCLLLVRTQGLSSGRATRLGVTN